jgi:hypothetical protein
MMMMMMMMVVVVVVMMIILLWALTYLEQNNYLHILQRHLINYKSTGYIQAMLGMARPQVADGGDAL